MLKKTNLAKEKGRGDLARSTGFVRFDGTE